MLFAIGGSSAASGSGRQRRMGHSGPPTGDFQLHSPSDDDGDDDDSDAELMRAQERSRTRGTSVFSLYTLLSSINRRWESKLFSNLSKFWVIWPIAVYT